MRRQVSGPVRTWCAHWPEMRSGPDLFSQVRAGLHRVREGGLEPPPSFGGLAPQASASAYSATRASADRTLAALLPGYESGGRSRYGGLMADSIQASVDPAGEVVDLCRELIRIDTSNYGDGSGPGERKAAEYVAGLLDEVGIESELHESSPGRTSVIAHWGGGGSRDDGLLVHGHLDVVPAEASDWRFDPFAAEVHDDYVWGRGAVDMKDFDAMVLSVV